MKRLLPYLQISIAMTIVGSNIVIGKLIAVGFPLFTAMMLRFALASLVLCPLALKAEGGLPRVSKRDLLFIFLQSLFGNFLYSLFLLYGLKLTTATESGIISGTAPVVTAAFSYLFLRERMNWQKVLGVTLVIIGIISINLTGGQSQNETRSLLGDLFICGAVVGESLWVIFSKAVSSRLSPLTLASLTTLFGFVLSLPPGIYQGLYTPLLSLPLTDWLAVVYYGLIGTVGAYILWYRAIPRVQASMAGVFAGITPVVAVLLSYTLLGEPFVWTQVPGILCVLVAIVCITASPSHAKLSMPASPVAHQLLSAWRRFYRRRSADSPDRYGRVPGNRMSPEVYPPRLPPVSGSERTPSVSP